MEKKLPEMFVNKVDKKVGNNKNVFYSSKDGDRTVTDAPLSVQDVNKKIREIFSSSNYVYKADVEITLDGKTVTKRIVGKNNMYLITIDNELIPIAKITNIKRK